MRTRDVKLLAVSVSVAFATACSARHDTGADASGPDAGPALADYEAFHLRDTEVAANLGLDFEGGTFRHRVNLCSIAASSDGVLGMEGATIVLLPASGSDRFLWYSAPSSDRSVTEVRLTRTAEGLSAAFDADTTPIEEVWITGGSCPRCGGAGGTMPCDDPFTL